jgi:hypothetical protein
VQKNVDGSNLLVRSLVCREAGAGCLDREYQSGHDETGSPSLSALDFCEIPSFRDSQAIRKQKERMRRSARTSKVRTQTGSRCSVSWSGEELNTCRRNCMTSKYRTGGLLGIMISSYPICNFLWLNLDMASREPMPEKWRIPSRVWHSPLAFRLGTWGSRRSRDSALSPRTEQAGCLTTRRGVKVQGVIQRVT